MTINLKMPDIRELKPRITVFGVGGAGGNAVNNMITAGLLGCDFVVANTDAQALTLSKAERIIQMGIQVTEGLGAGSQPDVGRAAAEEVIDEIRDHLAGAHMVFVTAGMGGGTGTGAAPVVAQCRQGARHPDRRRRHQAVPLRGRAPHARRRARASSSCRRQVDTLLIIPNQNLFRVANEKTTFADAFAMADQVLYSGVACITDLMVKEGLINLDFADVRAVMREMGKAMMGTGEASGDKRALSAAEAAISNPLIDETSMKGAKGLLISITGGKDLDALRGRRGRDPHPRGSRPGRQHHRRRDLRRKPRRHRARLGRGDRHRCRACRRASRPSTRQIASPAVRGCADAGRARAGADARPAGGRGGVAACRADPDAARQHAAPGGAHRARPTRRIARSRRRSRRQPPPAADAPAPAAGRRGRRPKRRSRDRGRDDPADRAEALAVPRAGRDRSPKPAPQLGRTGAAVHSAAGGASGGACAAHAAHRGTADAGAEPDPRPPGRAGRAGRPAEAARVGLLQRLASVGLGRREEEETETRAARARRRSRPSAWLRRCRRRLRCRRCSARPSRVRPSPCRNMPSGRSPQRPAPQGLDQHGRQAPVNNSMDDDQLEIPAFLRRQAN